MRSWWNSNTIVMLMALANTILWTSIVWEVKESLGWTLVAGLTGMAITMWIWWWGDTHIERELKKSRKEWERDNEWQ